MESMHSLHLTRGLPASGKSTFAKAWVAEDPENRARVNRDELRLAYFGKPYGLSSAQERQITALQQQAVSYFLTDHDVIVDDTNLNSKFAKEWLKVARRSRARVAWHDEFLDVPLLECIDRDRKREVGQVGSDVIESFYRRYLAKGRPKAPELAFNEIVPGTPYKPRYHTPEAFLIDLDGTIANNDGHRGYFEWAKVGDDKPHDDVIRLVRILYREGLVPIFVSGREDVCFSESLQWVKNYVFQKKLMVVEPLLFMRKEGDKRPDFEVKLEIFDNHIRDSYNVLYCLDDRNQVVEAYRSIGLRVLQVAPGDF